MSEASVEHMIDSVGAMQVKECQFLNASQTMYLRGSMINELLLIKYSKQLKKFSSTIMIMIFKGYSHAELAICHPQEWLRVVENFIESGKK